MTIAESLTTLSTDITATYDKIAAKGGSIPQEKNTNNLPGAVESIPAGGTPVPADDPLAVPEFDGGEYGAIAYLDENNEIAYYTAESVSDLRLSSSLSYSETGPAVYDTVATTNSGQIIVRSQVLAVAIGPQTPVSHNWFCANMPNLRCLYGLENWGGSTIFYNFLSNCPRFNSPLHFPDTISIIRGGFMSNCTSFNQPIHFPEALTSWGAQISGTTTNSYSMFMKGCSNFNQPITFPPNVNYIPAYFLAGAISFNQPLQVPEGVIDVFAGAFTGMTCFNSQITFPSTLQHLYTSLQDNSIFNCSLAIPDKVTSLPAGFLSRCYLFNQSLTLPARLTTIGATFLSTCSSFNQSFTLPTTLTSIGDGFMYECSNFNQPLIFPEGLKTLGTVSTAVDGVLKGCVSFNQPIVLPSTLTTLGTYFMYGCIRFNSVLTFAPSESGNTLSIGGNFMGGCSIFNQPLHINRKLSSGSSAYSSYFMQNCTAFNSLLTFLDPETTLTFPVPSFFLDGCTSFNQPLTLPSYFRLSNGNFMKGCTNFQSTLTLPEKASTIGIYFLSNANWGEIIWPTTCTLNNYAFSKGQNTTLIIPSNVTSTGTHLASESLVESARIEGENTAVGSHFLYDAKNLSDLYVANTSGVISADNYTLSTSGITAPMYVDGVTLSGPAAERWKTAYPDRTSNPYRKLILATEPEEENAG